MRFRSVPVFVVALLLLLSHRAAHADAASPVDASTVRVFAVGTVGVENVEAPGNQTVAMANASAGHGTGFVVEANLIVTAQHVVEGARHVVVRLPGDGGFFPARVVFGDKAKDVAVLAVDGALPPPLTLSADAPRVRSTVFAVGYPLDATRKQPQSARGIIAGYLDDGTVQLDMALNPGNSGGPIVNEQDVVVGVASARGSVEQGVQGIGYAVPVQMIQAALVEAKRRLASGEAPGAAGMSRDSAMVVDELVQHGVFHQLRKLNDLAAAPAGDVDKELASLTARIQDADLLVFVASAMWNVSLVLEYVDPAKLKLTADQAFTLRTGLRDSARAAVRRAVQLDSTVGARSAFVGLVTGDSTAAAPGATGVTMGTPPVSSRNIGLVVEAAPIVRVNANTGSTGYGGGASFGATFGTPKQSVTPLVGVAIATTRVSNDDGTYGHTLVAAQLGVRARLDDGIHLAVAIELCAYSASVLSTTNGAMGGSASEVAVAGRMALGYRIGKLELGAAARMLGGPTLWIEPIYASVSF
jgi:hypothetical protein